MVDDRLPNGKATAFDASVYTDEQQVTNLRQVKTAAAVEYFDRELGKMDEAVTRLEGKLERFQAHVEEVERELQETKDARDALEEQRDSAQTQLEELVTEEVAP